MATEVAESLLKDWITVQQFFQTHLTGSSFVLQTHRPQRLQRLPHYRLVSLAERLLVHPRSDT